MREAIDKKNEVVVAGDGRHDSMGHSAKYCAYTLFNCTSPNIIHFSLVQVRVLHERCEWYTTIVSKTRHYAELGNCLTFWWRLVTQLCLKDHFHFILIYFLEVMYKSIVWHCASECPKWFRHGCQTIDLDANSEIRMKQKWAIMPDNFIFRCGMSCHQKVKYIALTLQRRAGNFTLSNT